MTIQEAIELFKNEMINEIFHHVSDDALQDTLIEAVKEVSTTVMKSYEADNKSSK